jgi:O-antigen/teichoic acid export membrane protein
MDHESLKRRTFGSIVWMTVATGWSSLASFVTFAILARLLDPYTFGVFTLAQIVYALLSALTGAAFNDYVIQKQDLTEDVADTLFWSNLAINALLAASVWSASDLYARFMNVPDAALPLRCLGLALPIDALATIHLAKSLREFGHRIVAIRAIGATFFGGGLGILAAYWGFGVWSLIVQLWATSISNVILVWLATSWIPGIRFCRPGLREFLPFAARIMTSQFLWVVILRIPEFVLGGVWGPAAVANYRVGWRLTEILTTVVLQPMSGVALAVFSKLKGQPDKFGKAYSRFTSAAAIALLPSLFGLAAVANELVPLLFGQKWSDSVIVVQILSLMGLPLVLNFQVGQVLTAVGAVDRLPRLAILQTLGTLILSTIVVPYGVAAVCLAYVFRTYAMLPYQQHLLFSSSAIAFMDCLKAVRAPLLASVAMTSVLYLFRLEFHALFQRDVFYLATVVPIGAIIYVLTLLVLDQTALLAGVRLFVGRKAPSSLGSA